MYEKFEENRIAKFPPPAPLAEYLGINIRRASIVLFFFPCSLNSDIDDDPPAPTLLTQAPDDGAHGDGAA